VNNTLRGLLAVSHAVNNATDGMTGVRQARRRGSSGELKEAVGEE